jgi:hypothetical protein
MLAIFVALHGTFVRAVHQYLDGIPAFCGPARKWAGRIVFDLAGSGPAPGTSPRYAHVELMFGIRSPIGFA